EYNGYLRIPTDEDYGAGLVILDKELNIVSELYGIGGNQKEPHPHDVATYKNVAVFGRGTTWYVVDVSDPAAPKVMNGIDGANQNYDKAFLSEDTLLTSVFCRDDAKEYNGIRLETYDISDEKNIVKTGEVLLENNSRELQYRLSPWSYRQSVSAVSEKEFTVVPYTIEYWDDTTYVRNYMLALFSTEDGLTLVSKQEIERVITEGTKTSRWQAMYIDGTVYFVNMALGTKETDITAINIYTFNSTDLTPTGRYTNE
ncbi:MAG: beta-propeller domain-containing protein, partial [Clostridia bacterium]|nr:beta-propeller domain-containing protein [Clostridia bacterium]